MHTIVQSSSNNFFLFFFHKRIFAYKIFKVLRSKHAVLDLENLISAGNSQYAIIWVEKKEKRLRKKEKRSASLILPGIKKIILFCLPCPICYSAINLCNKFCDQIIFSIFNLILYKNHNTNPDDCFNYQSYKK